MARLPFPLAATLLLILAASAARAQARFDLAGPRIEVRVTRAGVTLPIAAVPNLQPGDQLWLHPDLPPSQSVHYLLIATFLRGTTNPPPDSWFNRIETWDRKVREEGVTITVPPEAQQAILFLAPETGGDFSTLRSAVKGRPGIFVRASQDLTEAGFEQARIEKYLAAMKLVPPGDPKALQEHSDLLARTLNLKPNPDCFKRSLDLQYNCLTQTGSQTLLDDGHANSIVAALSTGPGSDFINAASYTSLAGAGTYSAYVGAIVDLLRILNGIHTAKYQYIPAIAFPDDKPQAPALRGEALNLRLNTPPSFNNPKSVIVIGLPAVLPAIAPPLQPVDPSEISCLLDPMLALPVQGAPLVFSTDFAHNLILHLNIPRGADLALTPDAYHGGLALAEPAPERRELATVPSPRAIAAPHRGTARPSGPATPSQLEKATDPGAPVTGTIQGMWGFDHFTGPTVAVQQAAGRGWHIVAAAGQPNLIAGQPNHLEIAASGTACIQFIALEPGEAKVEWKFPAAAARPSSAAAPAAALPTALPPPAPKPVELTLNLEHAATPGSIHLAIGQFGQAKPDQLGAESFAQPAHIDALLLHAADTSATLTGTSLDQVQSVTLKDLAFTPRDSADASRTLNLALAKEIKSPPLKPAEKLVAEVHLRDGRTLAVPTVVLPARPVISILSRRTTRPPSSPIQPGNGDELPLGAELAFFLKSRSAFPRSAKIEIAGVTDPAAAAESAEPEPALHTTLSIASGALVLEDAHTILATFDPLKLFGPSTFGPFRLRAVDADDTAGAWLPLATIVRLPTLTSLTCTPDILSPQAATQASPPVSTPEASTAPVRTSDPAAAPLPCTLTGSALYLIAAVATDPAFTSPITVPDGFVDTTLALPRPIPGQPATFYLRLRDDPTTTHPVTLPPVFDTPPTHHKP